LNKTVSSFTLVFAATMTLATFASASQAFEESMSCASVNGTLPVSIGSLSLQFSGDLDALSGAQSLPASGLAKQIQIGADKRAAAAFVGTVAESAKGPYYELSSPGSSDALGVIPSIQLFIAAPASKSFSELKVNGKVFEVICQ
jgi:hypothetical protein